jgi:hypothetical protein
MQANIDDNLVSGGVVIEELIIINQNGRSQSLANFFVEINIYEDVFSSCMTGKILIRDGLGLIHRLPIVGNERVVVKFRTPSFEDSPIHVIEKTFQVYGISGREMESDKEAVYSLDLISIEGYVDMQTTLAKSYEGNTDQVAATIFADYISTDRRIDVPGKKSEMIISDTPHVSRIQYTSNYWSPFKNMNFICQGTRGNKFFGSDYMFFESNKSFMFSSMEALIDTSNTQGLLDEYVYEMVPDIYTRKSDGKNYYGVDLPKEMTRISEISTPTTLDSIAGTGVGYYANAIRGFDFTTKKIIDSTFSMGANNDKFIKTGPETPIPRGLSDNPYTHTQFVSFNTSLYENYGITNKQDLPSGHPAEYYTDRIHFRKSYLYSLNQAKITMQIPGRTDIAVGQCISILYPAVGTKTTDDTADDMLDPYLSGVYLITALRHVIRADSHQIFAEVIRNGFETPAG